MGGPLGDEVLAVVDQELQLAQPRSWEARGRSASRRAARATARASIASDLPTVRAPFLSPRGQPGADPDDLLSGREEEALEAPVHVAAVLEGEAGAALRGQRVGPGAEALVALGGPGDGQLAEELSRASLTAAAVWVSLWGSIPIVINCGSYPLRCPRMAERRRTELGGAFKAGSYQVTPSVL